MSFLSAILALQSMPLDTAAGNKDNVSSTQELDSDWESMWEKKFQKMVLYLIHIFVRHFSGPDRL